MLGWNDTCATSNREVSVVLIVSFWETSEEVSCNQIGLARQKLFNVALVSTENTRFAAAAGFLPSTFATVDRVSFQFEASKGGECGILAESFETVRFSVVGQESNVRLRQYWQAASFAIVGFPAMPTRGTANLPT
ncbi:MAG: hypothetical protein SGJ19_21395 [Planctomycetia bacterium]|nr:hypothetical protein [Planctomycetia bacterium]